LCRFFLGSSFWGAFLFFPTDESIAKPSLTSRDISHSNFEPDKKSSSTLENTSFFAEKACKSTRYIV